MHTLYVDMDGVLVDFDKKRHELGISGSWFGKEEWKILDKIPHLFYHLDPMPDAFELWDYVKDLNPTILTAAPTDSANFHEAVQDKKLWIAKHIGADVEVIVTHGGKEKQLYATRESILIDDYGKNIGQWIKRGGIGILHMNAHTSIQIMNEIPSIQLWKEYETTRKKCACA